MTFKKYQCFIYSSYYNTFNVHFECINPVKCVYLI